MAKEPTRGQILSRTLQKIIGRQNQIIKSKAVFDGNLRGDTSLKSQGVQNAKSRPKVRRHPSGSPGEMGGSVDKEKAEDTGSE